MITPSRFQASPLIQDFGQSPVSGGSGKYLTIQQFREAVEDTGLDPQAVYESAKAQGYTIEGEDEAIKQTAMDRVEVDKKNKRTKELVKGGYDPVEGVFKNDPVDGFMQNVIGAAADSSAGLAKLGLTGVSNAAERIANKTGNPELAERMDASEKLTKQQMGDVGQDRDGATYKVAKTFFDLEQIVTGSGLVKGATKATKIGQLMGKLRKELGLSGKVIAGGLEGALETGAYEMVADSQLPTGKDLGIGAGLGAAFPLVGAIIGKLGNQAYDLAFNQAKQRLNEDSLQYMNKTLGQTVKDEALEKRSLTGMKKEIGGKLQNTRDLLQSKASKATPVAANQLGYALKGDIIDQLTKDIPKSTNNYKAIVANINDVVDFYVGTKGKLQGQELIAVVKEINAIIPDGALKKSPLVLSPKQSATAIQAMKNKIKEFLEYEVGDIVKLYGDYSRQKLIQETMQNLEVKKMLGRRLLGGVIFGAGAATPQAIEGDRWGAVKTAVITGLISGMLVKSASSPQFLSGLGRTLDNASTLPGNKAIPVINDVLDDDDESDN